MGWKYKDGRCSPLPIQSQTRSGGEISGKRQTNRRSSGDWPRQHGDGSFADNRFQVIVFSRDPSFTKEPRSVAAKFDCRNRRFVISATFKEENFTSKPIYELLTSLTGGNDRHVKRNRLISSCRSMAKYQRIRQHDPHGDGRKPTSGMIRSKSANARFIFTTIKRRAIKPRLDLRCGRQGSERSARRRWRIRRKFRFFRFRPPDDAESRHRAGDRFERQTCRRNRRLLQNFNGIPGDSIGEPARRAGWLQWRTWREIRRLVSTRCSRSDRILPESSTTIGGLTPDELQKKIKLSVKSTAKFPAATRAAN